MKGCRMARIATAHEAPRRRVLVVALAVGSALVVALLPTPLRAEEGASTCAYDGSAVRVELLEDDSGGRLLVDAATDAILYDDETPAPPPPLLPPPPAPCGGATTANTDRIVVKDTSPRHRRTDLQGSSGILLDVSQGHFADGDAEIPIKIDLGTGVLDTFGVIGGDGRDFWTFGVTRANLQNDSAGEIEFVRQPDLGLGVTGGGSDRACSDGGNGTGRTALMEWALVGGAGGDTLCGGLLSDRLIGKAGDDRLRGNGGQDVLKGGGESDHMVGNGSNDTLLGNKGGDHMVGGPGFDRCKGGLGPDREKRSER